MILVIFIKAVAELGVIPYTHLFIVNFIFLGDVKYSCLVVGFFVLKVFFRDITKIKKFRDGS